MPTYFGPFLTGYILFLAFALGACLGSFLLCAADRRGRGESPWRGRSHCQRCGHVLGVRDLVPVASWLWLRGRCRFCGARIGAGCLAAECLCGGVFLSVVWRFGLTARTAALLVLAGALVYLGAVDLLTMELPGGPMALAAAAWAGALAAEADPLAQAVRGFAGAAALGGGVLAVVLVADRVLGRETMGGGDIKLLALLGLYTGPGVGLLLLITACVLGLALAAVTGAGRGKEFPFGPAIALAAWPTLLFGQEVLGWYLGLF